MKIFGIVSEYNPFHLGHAWQLAQIHEKWGQDSAIIACMSGNFVQRGEAALLDRFARAETAVAGGINLVIELPVLWSICSAQNFAAAAIRLLQATGLHPTLSFGSESGRFDVLAALAYLIEDEPGPFRDLLKKELAAGSSFAAAQAKAAAVFITEEIARQDSPLLQESSKQIFEAESKPRSASAYFQASQLSALQELSAGDPNAAIWHSSNDRLGIAYLRALIREQKLTAIEQIDRLEQELFLVQRQGSAYLDRLSEPSQTFLSASALRHLIKSCQGSPARLLLALSDKLPIASHAAILAAAGRKEILFPENSYPMLVSRLRGSQPEELAAYAGWNEGLAERMIQLAGQRPTPFFEEASRTRETLHPKDGFDQEETKEKACVRLWDGFIQAARSKRMSEGRIKRALCALCLGIKQNEDQILLDQGGPFYIRVLAADKKGRYLLRRMRKSARLPIITKESDLLEIPATHPYARRQAEVDRCASDLYSLLRGQSVALDFDKVPPLV